MIKNPIKNPIFTKSGAARAYTVRSAGMSPRPPAGGHSRAKKTHVPGKIVHFSLLTEVYKPLVQKRPLLRMKTTSNTLSVTYQNDVEKVFYLT